MTPRKGRTPILEAPVPIEPRKPPRELWTRLIHIVPALAVVLFVLMGSRPGGDLAIQLYLFGPLAVGLLAALCLAVCLAWSVYRRPLIQPGRVITFVSLGACLWLASFPLPYPSSHDGQPSSVRFELPLRGEWRVRWGGEQRRGNALVLDPARRHGFDLVRAGEGDGGQESMEASVGAEVFAPAAGEVIQVETEVPGSLGAYVVLRVAEGEYLFLGGLEAASVAVEAGSQVERRDLLAKVGRSAHSRLSPGPHLAIHLQDDPELGRGEAIPMRFFHLLHNGQEVSSVVPVGGLAEGRHVGSRVRRLPE